MVYTPIVGTLAYVLSPDGGSVLLVRRDARPDDHSLGKYNGLGGKLEADESVAAGMRRELAEEADIEVVQMRLRGTISWPGFGPNGEDWLGFVFVVTEFTGTPPGHNDEGALVWEPVARLVAADDLPMWPGDRLFLPLVFADDDRQFHGVMPYHDGQPTDWRYEWI